MSPQRQLGPPQVPPRTAPGVAAPHVLSQVSGHGLQTEQQLKPDPWGPFLEAGCGWGGPGEESVTAQQTSSGSHPIGCAASMRVTADQETSSANPRQGLQDP